MRNACNNFDKQIYSVLNQEKSLWNRMIMVVESTDDEVSSCYQFGFTLFAISSTAPSDFILAKILLEERSALFI